MSCAEVVEPDVVGVDVEAEVGGHEQVAPVRHRLSQSVAEAFERPPAVLHDSEAQPVQRGLGRVFTGRQVPTALIFQHARGVGPVGGLEEMIYKPLITMSLKVVVSEY